MENTYPANILLVDDHRGFLNALAMGLEDCGDGVCILTAENGERALKVLESAPVSVVVTDLNMPVMGGFELLGQMREKYPAIPVIVMSAYLNPETEKALRAFNVHCCLDKSDLSCLQREIIEASNAEMKRRFPAR